MSIANRFLTKNRVFAIQNGMAAGLFVFLFITEALSYLLHAYPSVELLWVLSVNTDSIAGELLMIADDAIQIPCLLLIILATATLIPLISYRRLNWFGTAVSGHVALGGMVMMVLTGKTFGSLPVETASLSRNFVPANIDSGIASLMIMAMVMSILCLANHVMFFAGLKES